jgi:hypothetical protein
MISFLIRSSTPNRVASAVRGARMPADPCQTAAGCLGQCLPRYKQLVGACDQENDGRESGIGPQSGVHEIPPSGL